MCGVGTFIDTTYVSVLSRFICFYKLFVELARTSLPAAISSTMQPQGASRLCSSCTRQEVKNATSLGQKVYKLVLSCCRRREPFWAMTFRRIYICKMLRKFYHDARHTLKYKGFHVPTGIREHRVLCLEKKCEDSRSGSTTSKTTGNKDWRFAFALAQLIVVARCSPIIWEGSSLHMLLTVVCYRCTIPLDVAV